MSEPIIDGAKDRVVLLTTIQNEPLARMSAQVLEDEGIKTMLKPQGVGFGGWGVATTLPHDLYVLEKDHQRAADILAELNRAEYDPDAWQAFEPPE